MNGGYLWSTTEAYSCTAASIPLTVDNAPETATANANIKILVDLKLQLKRHTSTHIYLNTSDVLNDLEKVRASKKIFSFNNITFLPVQQLQTNWMKVYRYASLEVQVPRFEMVFKLQTNSITVYR